MKWTVGVKLGLGFGAALLIFVIVGGISYRNTGQLIAASEMRKHTYDVLAELSEIISSLKDVETGQRGYVVTGEERYLDPYNAGLENVAKASRDARALIADNLQQQRRLNEVDALAKDVIAIARESVELRRTGTMEAAVQSVKTGKGKAAMDAIRKAIQEMEEEENALLKVRVDEAVRNAAKAKATILFGTLLGLVISGVVGFVITRGIAGPLQNLTSVADKIALGDLNVEVSVNGRDDEVGSLAKSFARMSQSLRAMAGTAEQMAGGDLRTKIKPLSDEDVLGNAFGRMSDNLRRQITEITESANALGSSASEIAASTTQLASSAAQSATAVSETTTTVAEVRQTAQMSSEKARVVADAAQKANQISAVGRKSTDDATVGMGRIRQQMEAIAASIVRLSEQGQAIGLIIATVEDLAAQSNLLAVNASIEAAKAGEHGRGFSVVAQAVKSLADQSRQATNQVRTILSDIQKATTAAVMATEQGSKAVETGERQANAVGDSIQALAGNVNEAAQSATQIAASSQQQLVGMDQIAIAMESIKQASSQNVASARQLEIAARTLKEFGERLRTLTEQYKV